MPEYKEGALAPKTEKQIETREQQSEIVDLQQKRELVTVPRELKTWMQKIEEDPSTQQPNTNNNDDSILQPIATTVTKISLPINKETFVQGFSKPTDNAWKWLTTFILRIIKKTKGNVKFKEE